MNQKQIFTEYWKVLDDYEDYMNDRFRRERLNIPDFKENTTKSQALTPEQCCACSLSEDNSLRSSVSGEGYKKVIIINRALSLSAIEKREQFTPQELDFVSKWLEAIGLDYHRDCKILPLVFCPVKNPLHVSRESINSCSPFIDRIIDETNAKAILILGKEGNDLFRNKNIPVFVSHHPSDVLIDLSLKRPVWEVLKNMKDILIGE